MSSSRKKHIVAEMKKIVQQRKAELEFNEREIIQHVKYISEETMGLLNSLLKETDKKKFLKAFPSVSVKMDKSLTALMMIKASLPSLESDESSTDCASDGETVETGDTATLEERTDDSTIEIEQSASPSFQSVTTVSGSNNQVMRIDSEPYGSTSPPSVSSSHQSASPNKESNSSMSSHQSGLPNKESNSSAMSSHQSGSPNKESNSSSMSSHQSVSPNKESKSSAMSSHQSGSPNNESNSSSMSSHQSVSPNKESKSSAMSSHQSGSPNKESNSSSMSSHQSVSPNKESKSSLSSQTFISEPTRPQETTQEKALAVPSCIPREILPLVLPIGMKVEVVVSEVVSPSIFWIQPTQSRIVALMDEIRRYYNSVVKLPPLQPKVGMYSCACYTNDDCWYRARIIAIHLSPPSVLEGGGVHVDVIYIDYGNRERIPESRLRPLHPRFMTDPAQAVCCKLARKIVSTTCSLQLAIMSSSIKSLTASDAGKIVFLCTESVKPTGKGVSHWSTDETDFFTQMTFGRKLTAIVIRQPGSSSSSSFDLPALDLLYDHYFNDKETTLVDVAKMMVSQKRALPDDQCSTTDSYQSHTTHTTDSDVCQSPNAATDLSLSTTPITSQQQGNDQGHEEGQQEKKESGSSGKKKKKKKTKRTKRHHDPDISTEDTDVPHEEVRNTRHLDKEESRKDSTSDTPVCDSEYTTEKRVPGLCRTPETSCTETEDKQIRPHLPAEKVSSVALTTGQTTSHTCHDVMIDGGTQEMEKESQAQEMSCGSESPRSCSPNSTSGVSSARSSTCLPQKNMKDPSIPGLISFNKKQGELNIPSSQRLNSQEGTKDKPLVVETAKEPNKETSMHITASAESDRLTDLTDQFFTCAEDISEADSTDREVARSKSDVQPPPSPVITKVDVIGRRYVTQRTLQEGEQIQFAMSHMVSPQEFYIHLITPDAKRMDYLLEELNSVYSEIEKAGIYRPPFAWLSIGAICCGKFGEDKRWYRGVVEDIRGMRGVQDGRHVLVRYVDFGNEEWVPEHLLYPLEKYLCGLAPLSFKCGMARIQPLQNDETDQTNTGNKGSLSEWSEECKRTLIGMSEFEKLLTGQVIRVEGTQKKCAMLEVRDNSEGEGVCLNQRLVDLGLASSSFYQKQPLQEQEPSQLDDPNPEADPEDRPGAEMIDEVIPDDWNPMVQHFSSEINSYGVDMDDPGVATTGMKSTIEGRVCKYYAVGKRCYKGVNCLFEHPKHGGGNVEQTEVFWCNTSVSLPEEGHWVALQVTAVHTSIHFWAQLPFGPKPLVQAQREWTTLNQLPEDRKEDGETLQALQDSINAIYQKSYTRREDLSLLALGEIVCAQFSKDDSWYRARIVDVNVEVNTVQVFYVDYGNCEWLYRSKVRPAMPQFLHLPFQAVECFLGRIELIKPTSTKDQDMDRKIFEELTVDKVLVGHVMSSDADILYVELYDTISSKHVNIGDALVNAGFARHTKAHQITDQHTARQGLTGK